MARSKPYASFSAVCMTIIFIATLSDSQAGVEETLAELNAKPAEERNRVIVENARKEGTAPVYTATNIRDTHGILAGFNKIYPFVKVAFSSLGGPGVLNKILTEYRAGAHLADIVVLNGINAVELIEKKSPPDTGVPWCRFCVRVLLIPRVIGREFAPSFTP